MGRKLEIGPGARLAGFEGFDILPSESADKVGDARKLPYPDGSFSLVYASHVIEHFPWNETVDVLREWARVLEPGGVLEIWTVNACVVAKRLLEYEETGSGPNPDPWKRFNPDGNPYLWCAGRLFAYEKPGEGGHYNWHKALFSPKHLTDCMRGAGLQSTRRMERSQVRGNDHGVINLGIRGVRP